jgi:hypothetical protein
MFAVSLVPVLFWASLVEELRWENSSDQLQSWVRRGGLLFVGGKIEFEHTKDCDSVCYFVCRYSIYGSIKKRTSGANQLNFWNLLKYAKVFMPLEACVWFLPLSSGLFTVWARGSIACKGFGHSTSLGSIDSDAPHVEIAIVGNTQHELWLRCMWRIHVLDGRRISMSASRVCCILLLWPFHQCAISICSSSLCYSMYPVESLGCSNSFFIVVFCSVLVPGKFMLVIDCLRLTNRCSKMFILAPSGVKKFWFIPSCSTKLMFFFVFSTTRT